MTPEERRALERARERQHAQWLEQDEPEDDAHEDGSGSPLPPQAHTREP